MTDSLTIPDRGLDELCRSWSGDGALFDALAVSGIDDDWTSRQIQKRARRVVIGELEEILAALPSSMRAWEPFLPITSRSERVHSFAPRGGVNWAQTVRENGWPPRRYVGRVRERVADELPLATLAWLYSELETMIADISSPSAFSPRLVNAVMPPISTLGEMLARLAAIPTPLRPDRLVVRSLRASGYPWTIVANAVEILLQFNTNLKQLAYALIKVEPDVAWRLFHLAVFGSLIARLRELNCEIRWNCPLAPGFAGPQLAVIAPNGDAFDLWFESSGMRRKYGVGPGPYPGAVKGIHGVGDPIGADIALVRPHVRGLLLECKWSVLPQYVGRYGYHQVSSYALDARAGLMQSVWGFVVGAHEVASTLSATSRAQPLDIILGSTSTEGLGDLVNGFLMNDVSVLPGLDS